MSKPPYSQQKEARQKNISLVLRDIWRHAPLSKSMLAERNGLTKATVSSICRDLEAQGLICDAGQDRTGVGRPGDLIELNPSAYCSVGLEISTNYIGVVLVIIHLLLGYRTLETPHIVAISLMSLGLALRLVRR